MWAEVWLTCQPLPNNNNNKNAPNDYDSSVGQ